MSLPNNTSPAGLIVSSEIAGTIDSLLIVEGQWFVRIKNVEKKDVYLSLASFPGGAEWVRSRIGKMVHVRLIARELQTGQRS